MGVSGLPAGVDPPPTPSGCLLLRFPPYASMELISRESWVSPAFGFDVTLWGGGGMRFLNMHLAGLQTNYTKCLLHRKQMLFIRFIHFFHWRAKMTTTRSAVCLMSACYVSAHRWSPSSASCHHTAAFMLFNQGFYDQYLQAFVPPRL